MSTAICVRTATEADLEVLVDIAVSAMPMDPQWPYRFPLREEYPEEHRAHTRVMFKGFFDPPDASWEVVLAEKLGLEDATRKEPIAMSVWNMSCLDTTRERKRSTGRSTCLGPITISQVLG